ncbi:MAG: sulfate ABC transporter ATP-binding protein [Rhizobiales bacterium]|nr:sulfate ABC transporter ATP-binding protein [Hyphomicrobiales bacterium]
MSVSVRAEQITKSFNSHSALRGVSLDIAAGELLALLGPSGSGKTTLLRIIAGLDFADSGKVLFDDTDTSAVTIQERNIGFVFQHYALFRHMRVFDNIAFGLRARPRHRRPDAVTIRKTVMTLLDLVQLSGLENRFPAQLSGGQRQRVALARALAIEPRVLLLDEPFGALDAKVRKELRRWLRELHDRTGHTTIFVTHDQEEALELADRVAILNDGQIEQIGSGEDLHVRPASAFVHRFVGDSIELPVAIVEGQAWFEGKSVYPLHSTGPETSTSLFLHPHDLHVSDEGPHTLPATVLGMRRTGSGRHTDLQIGGSALRVNVALPVDFWVEEGEVVHLRIWHAAAFTDNVVPLPRNRGTSASLRPAVMANRKRSGA